MEFDVGNVVRLKSGGPKMVVTKVSEDAGVSVVWFTSAEQVERATLPAETLIFFTL